MSFSINDLLANAYTFFLFFRYLHTYILPTYLSIGTSIHLSIAHVPCEAQEGDPRCNLTTYLFTYLPIGRSIYLIVYLDVRPRQAEATYERVHALREEVPARAHPTAPGKG